MRAMTKRLTALSLLILSSSTAIAAHQIELNNGEVFVGDVQKLQDAIIITTNYGKLTIPSSNVKTIKELKLIRISGSNTIGGKLMPNLAESYLQSLNIEDVERTLTAPREVTINATDDAKNQQTFLIKAHGSSSAFKALSAGTTDIGMSSRPIKGKELNALRQIGDFQQSGNETVLAMDALVILVHPDNPITQLDRETVSKIFSGEIDDWSAISSSLSGPIKRFRREDGSGTLDTFQSLVMKPYQRKLIKSAQVLDSNQALSDTVAGDPLAIGFTAVAYTRNAKALQIEECGIVSQATPFTIKTEEYPLSRRLYLYSPPQINRVAQTFKDYTTSKVGQDVVYQSGFIDLNLVKAPETITRTRNETIFNRFVENRDIYLLSSVQRYLNETKTAERLSVDFRFKFGSTDLDSRANSDIQRLKALMSQAKYQDKTLVLLGFADAIGDSQQNVTLSEIRAERVADALKAAGIERIVTGGIGSDIPIACNRTELERQKNRRVEVWLK